jgi:phosphoribosyl-ATP pyrophosphohydrolase/phosphoribosyl-AMP cyclohydrolase
MDGKAVQLEQGSKKKIERDNPLQLARDFARFGEVAVIDLDAALGQGENAELIRDMCRVAQCRVGGGIRTVEKAAQLIAAGAEKVIIGTRAFSTEGLNVSFLQELTDKIGRERIIIAIDTRHGEIVTRGWQQGTGLGVADVVKKAENFCHGFLFTCVEKEGMMRGADIDAINQLRQLTKLDVTVAGGIASLEEIRHMSAMGLNMQLGMAIYTGAFSMAEAFVASLKWEQELIPAVTIDTSGQVLMLAYMNHESLQRTFATGLVWYYSRSRGQLWQKGETSGHTQTFRRIRRDCDGDAVLVTAEQRGVACHRGSYSCFGAKEFSLEELFSVIQSRLANPSEKSYTATLTDTTLRQKIMEEAGELVEARGEDEVIWEAADLLYFTLVILAREGVDFSKVLAELKRRRRGSKS